MKFTDIKKGYGKLNAGGWVGNIPFPLFDGIRLQVRRIGNPDYMALQEKLQAEASGLAADGEKRRINDECLVQTCLMDWDGVDDKYSVDAARQLLADPDMGDIFRNALHWAVSDLSDQVKAELEADEKN